MVQAVLKIREEHPCWGKEKLANLLAEDGIKLSVSMTGRILGDLKDRGILKEPLRKPISAGKKARNRPYAIRKPKAYIARLPGDIVQVDTMDVRPLPGVIIKHFGARDVISKWHAIEASSGATASSTVRFIKSMTTRMPFPVKLYK
jgi:hypothetical protein